VAWWGAALSAAPHACSPTCSTQAAAGGSGQPARFVITLFFSPILGAVTEQVTAAALIVVGLMMAKPLSEIAWEEWECGIPAFIVILAVVRGKAKNVSPTMYALGLLFLAYFVFFTE